ncbi:MAG: hypothetical protein IM574_09255 [Cytophagales bacterium]|jgi:hypothetical protein|nr:hypothetical protein [Cytophagales bacterium]NOS56765.1 hypothetical protein [Cyclobacteriaceae bacterium]MCA6387911.1 hypothetical protein [Cytophagales bacterium]MCA6390991.1 hypothetical protein [Cytophagales bacterium]MCA6396935.1 hypothetical protein [Cytophagales bacterium]
MQAENLKYTLLDKIISVNDMSLLQKVNDLLGNVNIDQTIFKLTDAQKEMLMNSEEDILKGDLTTNDELNAEEDLWLNG